MSYQEFDLSLSYGTECQLYIVSTQFSLCGEQSSKSSNPSFVLD